MLGPALRAQADRRLVTLVREGYEAAFEEIVRRYGKPLGRYAGAIVGSRAEDVTQDAFSKALLALRRDDTEIDLRPWLYRIVRNTALNDLRDRPAAAEELAETIAGGRNPAEEFEQREELADLMKRLRALPESQRAAIVMRELEGLSHEEIAAALGLSGGAARQAIHRARTTLRNGAGLLLPLPLMRLLIDHGSEVAAASAGAGTATMAGGAIGGGGVLLKAGVVTAVLAGSVGTGVALREHRQVDSSAAAAIAKSSETQGESPGRGARATLPVKAEIASNTNLAESTRRHANGHDDALEGIDGSGPGNRRHGGKPRGIRRHGHRGPRHDGPRRDGGRRGPGPGRQGGDGSRSGPGPGGGLLGGGDGKRGDLAAQDGGTGRSGPGGGEGSGPDSPPPPPPDDGRQSGDGGSELTVDSSSAGELDQLP